MRRFIANFSKKNFIQAKEASLQAKGGVNNSSFEYSVAPESAKNNKYLNTFKADKNLDSREMSKKFDQLNSAKSSWQKEEAKFNKINKN